MAANKKFHHLSSKKHDNESQPLSVVYTQPEEEDEGGLDLGQVLAAIRRRMLIIVSITTAVTAASAIAALTSQPTYQARFEILTEPVTVENKLTSSLPESLNSQEDQNQVDGVNATELRILQSPQIMSPIVQQIATRYSQSDLTNLKLNPIPETNILAVTYEDSDPERLKFTLDVVAQAYLRYSLEERQTDIRQGIEFLEEQLPQLQQRVEVLQTRLQRFRQQHDLIDPEGQGKQLAERLNQVVQLRVGNATQLAQTRSLYNTVRSQLDLQPEEAIAASALSDGTRYQTLLNKLQEVDTQIAVESARYREESPTIQSLRRQRQNLLPLIEQEAQKVLGKKASITSNNTRGVTSPNQLRDKQTQQFLEAAQQIPLLEAQDKALAQAESTLRQQVKQFPVLARQNEDLERNLKIAVDNLNQFLSKREVLRIDAAQKLVPWQLITPPTKPQPSVASLQVNLFLGIGLGLLLGTGVALIIDRLTNVLYTPKEVKDKTKLLILGEIPFMQVSKKPSEAAGIAGLVQKLSLTFKFGSSYSWFQNNTVSQFWESLRSIYTNIRFLSFDQPVHSISVISATAEDGRSTIALYLAQTASAMGQKVLLVDADLRNPKIHAMLGLANTKGLSNIIVDENIELSSIIHNSSRISTPEVQPDGIIDEELRRIEELYSENNFFILTAGQVPPNPTNLLSSHRMQELAKQFSAKFDLVIYDTSPLLGIADGNLLAVCTDASLLVVRLGKTNSSKLETALEGTRISNIPILGVIANGTKDYSDTLIA